MPKLSGVRVTPKQLKILEYLFRVRGATVKQIVKGTGYESKDPKKNAINVKNFYPLLKGLVEKKLLDSFNAGYGKTTMFFLSPKGLDCMYDYFGIDEGYVGEGFNENYGYFDYGLYVPPKKNTEHFLMQTDVYNVVEDLKAEYPGVYDYRDNRYSSTFFTFARVLENDKEETVKSVFRPDGELLIEDSLYVIEVDRATEKGKRLNWKFEGYKRYFDYLVKEGKPLPKGIVFISEPRDHKNQNSMFHAGEAMRWRTLNKAFREELKEYAFQVNLIYTPIERFKKITMLLTEQNRKKALDSAISCIKQQKTNIRSKLEKEHCLFLFEKNGKRIIVIMQQAEGCESISWYKGYQLYKKYKNSFDDIRMIYYYVDYHTISPAPVNLKDIYDPDERLYYPKSLFMRIDSDKGIWFKYDNEIIHSNPLDLLTS